MLLTKCHIVTNTRRNADAIRLFNLVTVSILLWRCQDIATVDIVDILLHLPDASGLFNITVANLWLYLASA